MMSIWSGFTYIRVEIFPGEGNLYPGSTRANICAALKLLEIE
jgi:hypothetical protein